MQAILQSPLLPDVFRHKTTKVRVPQPKVILMDFHGTISSRRWEDEVIFPYVKQAIDGYLKANWNDNTIQRCLPGLRNESFEQRFRNRFDDAPVIDESVTDEEDGPARLATQMSDFLVWQMNSKKETRETQIIERLVWRDGLRQKKISVPIYDDVMPCVQEWHARHKCATYVVSSLEQETLKLLFSNTSKGDLDKYLTGYVSTKSGDKLVSDCYTRFYERVKPALGLPLSPPRSPPSSGSTRDTPATDDRRESSRPTSTIKAPKTSTGRPSSPPSSPSSSSSFEAISRPILFLTDSGQEAKAASQAAEGGLYECLLVDRPGNRRIRTYYLARFQYIKKFDDVEFVK
jgi:enolase-phosphatase E1